MPQEAWPRHGRRRTTQSPPAANSSLFREVFRIPETVAAERVVTVGQLSAPNAAGDPEKQALATARRNTDAAFETALAAIAEGQDASERRNSIAAVAGLISTMRQDIDRLTAVPRSSRPVDVLGPPLQPAQQAYLDTNRLLSAIQSGATLQDSVIQDNLDLARLAYSLRQWASQRGIALIGAITSGQPMTPAVIENLAISVGHLAEIWEQIKTYQETRQLGPDMLAAIATVQARDISATTEGSMIRSSPPGAATRPTRNWRISAAITYRAQCPRSSSGTAPLPRRSTGRPI